MSTTLHTILDTIKALVEGTAGEGRVVPPNKFKVVAEDENCYVERCIADPRPAYVVDGGSTTQPASDGDLSGDNASQYHWRARLVQIYVAYGFTPGQAPLARPTTIADDEEVLVAALTYDLNCAIVDGWSGATAESRIVVQRDERTGLAAIKWIVVDLTISYREERP